MTTAGEHKGRVASGPDVLTGRLPDNVRDNFSILSNKFRTIQGIEISKPFQGPASSARVELRS